jgi:hybrid cluster-associated redox disulfide protein
VARFKVTADTLVEEVLSRKPATAQVFVRLGLPCVVCGEPAWGTVAELCARHKKDLEPVLDALNRAADK